MTDRTSQRSRREAMLGALALGCSAAASPLLTPVVLASTPGELRLVVIVLRGGMDGLDVIRPVGDAQFRELRPDLAGQGTLEVGAGFALHPALKPLLPLWQAGEVGAVHATSTPYRDKRSHFDGQDILEAGTPGLSQGGSGWLNRTLDLIPQSNARLAFALGQDQMKLLTGPVPVSEWVPGASLNLSPQAQLLAGQMMLDDPRFADAWAEALDLSGLDEASGRNPRGDGHKALAQFAVDRLLEETRVASFSLSGWDTHANQKGALPRALRRLVEVIETFHTRGAQIWDRTLIMAMTEFGRTARQNGTGGTDHGTGGAMILAGGALRGGQVLGDWPGLSEAELYGRRDLLPTSDLRGWVAQALHSGFGIGMPDLERSVFPGVTLDGTWSLLL